MLPESDLLEAMRQMADDEAGGEAVAYLEDGTEVRVSQTGRVWLTFASIEAVRV